MIDILYGLGDNKCIDRKIRESLMSLEFLYQNPNRWFDTPIGSSLLPSHPRFIHPHVMDKMELKNPGYKEHITLVINGLNIFYTINPNVRVFSSQGTKALDEFLKYSGIKV